MYNTPVVPVPDSVNSESVRYFVIPYFGKQAEQLKSELKLILGKYFPSITFRIILSNSFKISSFFQYKDKLPMFMRSCVVYKFSCTLCSVSEYVGSTVRTLGNRIAEHSGRSYRTGALLCQPSHSAIRNHCEECGVNIKLEHFKILGHTSNNVDVRILESMHIYKCKPILNDMSSSFPLSIVC